MNPATIEDRMFHPLEDSSATADIVVPILIERYNPKSVLDLGCNAGSWIKAFKRAGVSAVGVDGPGMGASIEFDLNRPFDLGLNFDLVLCLEVAEHIAPGNANVLVSTCVRHAKNGVIWSAAVPGQGGYRHVNEQHPIYWSQLFSILYGWTGAPLAELLPPLPHDYYRKNMWEFRP